MIEDMSAAERLEQLEAIIARNEIERQSAENASTRLEVQRHQSLNDLSREALRKQEQDVAERRRVQEEYSKRYDAHMARVQPDVDRILAQIAELDMEEQAERERSAAALVPLSRRKLELAREISVLLQPPPADASPEPATARARLRALVGGRA